MMKGGVGKFLPFRPSGIIVNSSSRLLACARPRIPVAPEGEVDENREHEAEEDGEEPLLVVLKEKEAHPTPLSPSLLKTAQAQGQGEGIIPRPP